MTPVKGRLAYLYNQEITIEYGTEADKKKPKGSGMSEKTKRVRNVWDKFC